jgi:hypothetical protein
VSWSDVKHPAKTAALTALRQRPSIRDTLQRPQRQGACPRLSCAASVRDLSPRTMPPVMNADDVRALARAGLTIGLHTVQGRRGARLQGRVHDGRATRERWTDPFAISRWQPGALPADGLLDEAALRMTMSPAGAAH